MVPEGEPILCVHPSNEVSGTVRSASVAAKGFPDDDIRVIDTRTIASPLGTMVQLAAVCAEQGQDVDTIVKKLDGLIKRRRIYFIVPTLEYLIRGGRIGGASALFGSIYKSNQS
ncbi:DegV family protein [Chloroflexota bacterium]